MKNIAKIFLTAAVCLAVLTALTACTFEEDEPMVGSPQEEVLPVNQDDSAESSVPLTASRPEEQPLEPAGDLGKYHIEIGDYTMEKDVSGNSAIVISYIFTNNSDEAESTLVALSDNAFQNGVSLESAFFLDDSIVDSSATMKDVQPGGSLEIKKGYVLSSSTAPVEFEVSESFSFDGAMLGKTFVIDESGKTEYPTAPQGGTSGELGDYTVSIVSCEIGDDYDGSDVLIVHYGFTNNGKRNASFSLSISAQAFQGGVELERAYFADSNESSMLYLKPGAGIEVVEAYELPDLTKPVDIELSEYLSFSDEKITTTVELK